MKYRYRRGFTLVEMIATVTILGIVSLIALPTIRFFNQNDTKCEMFELAFEEAAKLYIDSNAEDEFGNQTNGCVDLSFSFLSNEKKLIDDIDLKNTTCNFDESFVRVRKIDNNYHYETYLSCKKTAGEQVCPSTGSPIVPAGACTNTLDTAGPSIDFSPNGNTEAVKNISPTIIIRDDYGYAPNLEIEYWWEDAHGNRKGSVKRHNFSNKIKYSSTPELKVSVNSPTGLNGEHYLVVRPVHVMDTIGNVTDEDSRSNKFIFDNSAPTLVVNAYKRTSTGGKTGNVIATATANASHPSVSLNSYNGTVNGWFNKNFQYGIYYEASYQDTYSRMQKLTWKWNTPGLLSTHSNYSTLGSSSSENISSKNTSNQYLSAEGQRRSSLSVSDHLDLSSTVHISVNFDYQNPSITSLNCSKTTNSISCNVTANDNLSGVWKYSYRINNGAWTEKTANSHTFSGLASGNTYRVEVLVKDKAGNTSSSMSKNVTTDVQYFGQYLRNRGVLSGNLGGMYRFTGNRANNYVCIADKNTCLANRGAYLYRVLGVASQNNDSMGVRTNMVKVIRNELDHAQWGGGNWNSSIVRSHVNNYNFGSYERLIPEINWRHSSDADWNWTADQAYSTEQTWGTSRSKKAIMYVSDYLYAAGGGGGQSCRDGIAGNCRNSWIFAGEGSGEKQWNYEYTLSYCYKFNFWATIVIRDRSVAGDQSGALWAEGTNASRRIRAVFYLTDTTKYLSGTGSWSDPYIIG